ncbi:hypothetical protein [Marinomonas fungiae]|uniref:hypothetical protein n=1 Tax=Marinomonas fungiae TaxID=1137284 RepID=UPI003A93F2B5
MAGFSSLQSLTGGGGLDAGSSAGGNDSIDGGVSIMFPPLPPLPTLGGGSSFLSNTGTQSTGVSVNVLMVILVVGIAAYVLAKVGGK